MSALPAASSFNGFGGVGGGLGPNVEAGLGQVVVGDRGVQGGVIGVGKEVEHDRERALVAGAEIAFCLVPQAN